MSFNGVRKDLDIRQKMRQHSLLLDPTPHLTQQQAFLLRPRSKDQEVGPDMKFAAKIQLHRINDEKTLSLNNTYT